MRNQKTHIKTKISKIILVILVTLTACTSKQPTKEVYVAEVGNTKLTQKEIEKHLGSNVRITKYKEEFVHDWVEKEILSQISEEKKLLNYENFDAIIKSSRKELSASIAIQDYLRLNPIKFTDEELKDYFNINVEDYNYSDDTYILNYVSFKNEESAILFRDDAITNGWESAIKNSNSDEILEGEQNKTFKLSEIQSKPIIRVLKKLYNSEISLVIETELNNFVVVQQIEKISKDSLPQFKYVKNNVKKSFIMLKQRELIRNYLDSLLTQKNIKIY